jgi:hypothetical protein
MYALTGRTIGPSGQVAKWSSGEIGPGVLFMVMTSAIRLTSKPHPNVQVTMLPDLHRDCDEEFTRW